MKKEGFYLNGDVPCKNIEKIPHFVQCSLSFAGSTNFFGRLVKGEET
jgi:hypothetical protein